MMISGISLVVIGAIAAGLLLRHLYVLLGDKRPPAVKLTPGQRYRLFRDRDED